MTKQLLMGLIADYGLAYSDYGQHYPHPKSREAANDIDRLYAEIDATIEAFGKERFDAGYEAGADYEPGGLTR